MSRFNDTYTRDRNNLIVYESIDGLLSTLYVCVCM